MARYTLESRERVRDAVDFAELVGARTELRQAGPRRMVGLCPFHDERTPSFGIDPVEKLYHCFGCGEGGDLFKFVMETEGLDFPGALEMLADRTGVQLEREAEDPGEAARRGRRERLLALLERTAAYYVRVLWEGKEAEHARDYLRERGLEEGTLREFRVGYSPSTWDRVLMASRRAGFSEEELLAAGLAARGREGGIYDRFRARLMFPLCDETGRVVGFGARALREGQRPKYLNSSEGEVFHKGRQLYGLHLARASAAKAGNVVVCEGYTDVIALRQAGIQNAVGMMGTALTDEQARILRTRAAPSVLLCLDADAAGQTASLRSAASIGRDRLGSVHVVPLPPGRDPADIVGAEGAEAMRALLAAAVPLARFRVERALATADLSSIEGRDRALAAAVEVIGDTKDPILRDDLVKTVADRLQITPELTAAAVAGAPASGAARAAAVARGGPPAARGNGAHAVLDRRESAERGFLALCVALPEEGERRLAEADLDELFASPATRRAAAHLRGRLAAPASDLPIDDDALARLIAELVIRAGEFDNPSADGLELEFLQLESMRLDRAIAAARTVSEGDQIERLAAERQRVRETIRRRLQ